MVQIDKISETLHRLVIPYKDISTTVYLLKAPDGVIIFDTATTAEDIDAYVLPMLNEVGVAPEAVKYIFISHDHRDHAGGIARVLEEYPDACLVTQSKRLHAAYGNYRLLSPKENDLLLDTYRVITIPGHTADSSALLDTCTNTLITGDSLQLYGIYGSGDWGANITLPTEHLAAIEKVRALRVDAIFMAHDYHPCGYTAARKYDVERALNSCIEPLMKLKTILIAHPTADDATVRTLYNGSAPLPTISEKVVAAMRAALYEVQ